MNRCHTLDTSYVSSLDYRVRIIVANSGAGRLYVVATPIGNLGDFSPRAVEVLRACAVVAAEDTRRTGVLLQHFGITTPLLSLHEHNEQLRAEQLIARLRAGDSVALVSDAGTPAISDPGFDLVCAAVAAGIEILAIPGPSALIAALSVAGLPTDRFCFEGFLPARSAARRARLEELAAETRTLVFYESPYRIAETLADCAQFFGGARRVAIGRELTKLHETVYRGSLAELCDLASADKDLARGEIVLAVAGAPAAPSRDAAGLDRVLGLLLAELPLKQAARLAAAIEGVRDNEAYKRALVLKRESAEKSAESDSQS
jgi:16S rRNA (cytidine1402-2'-O)-methyltransferase